jgi:hypothetical protein
MRASESAPGGGSEERFREGISAAVRALEGLIPQIRPEEVRRQAEAVVALLRSL